LTTSTSRIGTKTTLHEMKGSAEYIGHATKDSKAKLVSVFVLEF